MANLNVKSSFNNAVIRKDGDQFFITEYKVTKDGEEELGTYNLTNILENTKDTEYVALNLITKSELQPDA